MKKDPRPGQQWLPRRPCGLAWAAKVCLEGLRRTWRVHHWTPEHYLPPFCSQQVCIISLCWLDHLSAWRLFVGTCGIIGAYALEPACIVKELPTTLIVSFYQSYLPPGPSPLRCVTDTQALFLPRSPRLGWIRWTRSSLWPALTPLSFDPWTPAFRPLADRQLKTP